MVWRANLTMGCDYFNDRWLSFTGRTLEQEVGHGWTEGVHPEDRARCLRTYFEAFARQETFDMEYRLRRFDGTFRWIHDRGAPFRNHLGRFAGYVGTCADVTETVERQPHLPAGAKTEMQTLRRLLPICAWCHNVRDDDGHWRQLESALAPVTTMRLSHGICPSCAKQFLGEVPEVPPPPRCVGQFT
jgi:PAS domain S-box-containing protein